VSLRPKLFTLYTKGSSFTTQRALGAHRLKLRKRKR